MGQGRCWGSNHRPDHKKGPCFLSDWTQMHSNFSRDSWLSAPFGHQPIGSHSNCKHTEYPTPSPLINYHYPTTGVFFVLFILKSFMSCTANYLSHLYHSRSSHSSTYVSVSSLPGNTVVSQQQEAPEFLGAHWDSSVTLLIFSFGCVRSAGKWLRASQLSTTWVCSSVPVTMFPTALRAAVWMWRWM